MSLAWAFVEDALLPQGQARFTNHGFQIIHSRTTRMGQRPNGLQQRLR